MLQSESRPLIPVFVFLTFGIFLSSVVSYRLTIVVTFLLLLLLWLFLEYHGRQPIAVRLFWLLLIISGYLLAVLQQGNYLFSSEPTTLSGHVISVRRLNYYQRVIIDSPKMQGYIALHAPLTTVLEPGMWVEFTGILKQPESARNPGEFNYRAYLRSQGVFAYVEPEELQIVHHRKNWLSASVFRFQKYIEHNLEKVMKYPELASALVLGNRDALSSEQQTMWKQLGITHLLAVSGMHIGLLAACIVMLTGHLPGPRLLKNLMVILFLLFYVLLAGASPSAWRAWLAAVIGLLGRRRRLDGLHVWSLAGTIMLLLKPHYVWQIAFQLSFAASGGILLWSPAIGKISNKFSQTYIGRIFARLFTAIAISLVAQASIIPLLVNHFSEIALLAPVATVVFTPAVFVLLIGGFIVGIFGPWIAPLGYVLDQVTVMMDMIGRKLLRYSMTISAGTLPWDWTLVWYCCFISLGIIGRRHYLFLGKPTYARWLIGFLVLSLLVSLPIPLRRPLEITFLDVGQGDCIFIRTPYGQHILIDGGGDSIYWQQRGKNVGLKTVVPYLQYRGVEHIDVVILSHPHEDHLFGLLAVLEHFHVGLVVDNGQPHTTPSYKQYLQLIEDKNIDYHTARSGDKLKLSGGITLEVLHPSQLLSHTNSDINNNSLVINLSYHGCNVLFTGDIEIEGLNNLLSRQIIHQVDVIKVPHHGSKTAFMPELYLSVQPRHAVISVGRNSFGHPDPSLLTFLAKQQIDVSRTDESGAVSYLIWNGLVGRCFTVK